MISRRLSSLLVTAVLLTGPVMGANPRPQDDKNRDEHARDQQNQRVYDSQHKDYHNWNADEDQQWRQYLSDQHQKYHDFSKANKKEQDEYWNWRHDHDDHH